MDNVFLNEALKRLLNLTTHPVSVKYIETFDEEIDIANENARRMLDRESPPRGGSLPRSRRLKYHHDSTYGRAVFTGNFCKSNDRCFVVTFTTDYRFRSMV